MKKIILLISCILISCIVLFAQTDATKEKENPLNSLDIYAKVIGVVITGLGTIFGLPIAIVTFKKTRAEIRKLELETKALEYNSPNDQDSFQGNKISIEGSKDVHINIASDPRFLGPLLLLLDFIIAWIILTMMSYFLNVFLRNFLADIVVTITGCILFVPILKESMRVRKILRPGKENYPASTDNVTTVSHE